MSAPHLSRKSRVLAVASTLLATVIVFLLAQGMTAAQILAVASPLGVVLGSVAYVSRDSEDTRK